jgi:hypothetical protein
MAKTAFEELTKQITKQIGFDRTNKKEQLAAVRKCGYSIKFIHNPDKEVQLAAIKEDSGTFGDAIRHIRNPDKEVQLEAVRQNGPNIQYICNPDKEVQLAAVRKYVVSPLYIHNPDKEVQLEAVRQSDYDIEIIAMCPDLEDFAEEIYNEMICKDIIE